MKDLEYMNFTENPFCIRHKMLDVKTGDLGKFLVEFFQVDSKNSSISRQRLNQFCDMAISAGMEVQWLPYPLASVLNQNWEQFKAAMSYFSERYPEHTKHVVHAWPAVALQFIGNISQPKSLRKKITEETILLIENAYATDPDDDTLLFKLAEICFAFSKEKGIFSKSLRKKTIFALDSYINESTFDPGYVAWLHSLKANIYYSWGKWSDALEESTFMSELCTCGRLIYPGISYKLDICQYKLNKEVGSQKPDH